MKIALVHDDFSQRGGAENLFATIAQVFKSAPIYTSLVDANKLPPSISRDRLKTSFLQKVPFATKFYKALLPFYPLAFETFNFDDFNVVISSTTRFAKAIITKPNTIHICYINSTPRFLYSQKLQEDYLAQPIRLLAKPLLAWFARWDPVASTRVDHYIANSNYVASQVKKIYKRQAEVVYPFVDLAFFRPAKVHNWQLKSRDYFLVVSRLVKWKKIDIAIKACSGLDRNLIIVGVGPDKARLKQFSDSSVDFLGRVTREKLRVLYQNARALIITQQEDFGIAAVEAGACGTPVLAFKSGGAAETVINHQTGLLFESQTVDSLKDAIEVFSHVKWTVPACRKNALKFSQAQFLESLKREVAKYGSKSS